MAISNLDTFFCYFRYDRSSLNYIKEDLWLSEKPQLASSDKLRMRKRSNLVTTTTKTAVITGSSSGIGLDIARAFLEQAQPGAQWS